jgi:hypothetical protein
MNDAEISEVVGMMAMAALKRLAKQGWHKIGACDCDNGWFIPGIPCEIGREEIEVKKAARTEEIKVEKAARIFAQWDALGLGYMGPKL